MLAILQDNWSMTPAQRWLVAPALLMRDSCDRQWHFYAHARLTYSYAAQFGFCARSSSIRSGLTLHHAVRRSWATRYSNLATDVEESRPLPGNPSSGLQVYTQPLISIRVSQQFIALRCRNIAIFSWQGLKLNLRFNKKEICKGSKVYIYARDNH